MKWPLVLAILFAGMGAVAVATFWIDVPPDARPRAHPTLDGVLQGGSGEAAHAKLWWLEWLFGALVLSAFGALIALATTRRGFGPGAWGVVLATIVVQAAFAGLVLSYHRTVGDPVAEPWGPFPAPTTWMLLVFYPSQLLFAVGYVVGFERWLWTPEDEAGFERVVRDERAERSS